MTIGKHLRAPCLAGALALLTLGASTALADLNTDFTSTLNVYDNNGTLTTGNWGTVDVNLTSATTATVTFTAASGYYFIDSNIADVQVNASTWTITDFTGTAAPGSTFSVSNLSNTGSKDVNGYGTLNQTVANMDGTAQAASEVDFVLTNTSGGTWSSADTVLTLNGSGYDAAAHVVECSGDVSGCANNSTYFVAETPTTNGNVPEPSAVVLFGSSMIGIGAIVRRRRASKVAA